MKKILMAAGILCFGNMAMMPLAVDVCGMLKKTLVPSGTAVLPPDYAKEMEQYKKNASEWKFDKEAPHKGLKEQKLYNRLRKYNIFIEKYLEGVCDGERVPLPNSPELIDAILVALKNDKMVGGTVGRLLNGGMVAEDEMRVLRNRIPQIVAKLTQHGFFSQRVGLTAANKIFQAVSGVIRDMGVGLAAMLGIAKDRIVDSRGNLNTAAILGIKDAKLSEENFPEFVSQTVVNYLGAASTILTYLPQDTQKGGKDLVENTKGLNYVLRLIQQYIAQKLDSDLRKAQEQEGAIAAHTDRLNQKDQEIAALRGRITELEQQIQQKNEEIARLRSDNDRLTQELHEKEELNRQLDERMRELAGLQEDKNNLRREVELEKQKFEKWKKLRESDYIVLLKLIRSDVGYMGCTVNTSDFGYHVDGKAGTFDFTYLVYKICSLLCVRYDDDKKIDGIREQILVITSEVFSKNRSLNGILFWVNESKKKIAISSDSDEVDVRKRYFIETCKMGDQDKLDLKKLLNPEIGTLRE